MNLSVIIPTKNEESEIAGCLQALRREFTGEILVVDGRSEDETAERAKSLASNIFVREPGLARQCNAGVARAMGDVLFFVAADCRVPSGWLALLSDSLRFGCVVGGGFRLRLDDPAPAYRVIEWGGNFRSRYLNIALPDQGLFVRKDSFLEAGGMPEGSLIPYASLCFELHRIGEFRILPEPMLASVRQWKRDGTWNTVVNHVRAYRRFQRMLDE